MTDKPARPEGTSAELAEARADASEQRADASEQRADASEGRADASEGRADASEARASMAEARAERRSDVTTARAEAGEARTDAVEARATAVESDMGALRREVSELKNGTSGLAEQVSTLALALQAVGQLQSRQAKVEAKVHEVEKKTISKAEAAAMQAEADRRLSAKRKRDVTKIYSLLGLITTVAVMIGLFVVNYLSDPVFSPLDNSRVQKINSVVAGTTGPAVLLGKDVSVTGTKCNTTDRPVAVQGVTTWVTVTPAGTALEAGRGTGERPPGCTTKTFDNAMPVGVVARTKELHDAGVKHVIWQVTGLETPVSKQRASSARWTTEPFEIVVP